MEQQFVVMAVGQEKYGASVTQVLSIEKPMEITRVPRTVAFIKGVVNLRGTIVPVVDLGERLGLASSLQHDESRIVIVQVEDMMVGMIVDAVTDVVTLADSDIQPAPSMVGGLSAEFLQGIAEHQRQVLILLHLPRLFNHAEQLQLKELREQEER